MKDTNKPTPAERLAALTALAESPGWADFRAELESRYEKARKGACDLTTSEALRAGCAGAANELEQLLRHVPALIATLTKRVEKEK